MFKKGVFTSLCLKGQHRSSCSHQRNPDTQPADSDNRDGKSRKPIRLQDCKNLDFKIVKSRHSVTQCKNSDFKIVKNINSN